MLEKLSFKISLLIIVLSAVLLQHCTQYEAYDGLESNTTEAISQNSTSTQAIEGDDIIHGDMILTKEQYAILTDTIAKESNKYIINPSSFAKRWPYGRVFYTIHPNVTNNMKRKIEEAMAAWESQTSIEFIPRNSETDYVEFVKYPFQCSSSIGKKGGKQTVRLSRICSFDEGRVIHLIGHTLGLLHEHRRPDRDDFIKVNDNNIRRSNQVLFNKYSSDYGEYNGNFDFESVMMWDSYRHSKNGQPAITKRDGSIIGVNSSISKGDAEMINKVYPNFYDDEYVENSGSRNSRTNFYFADVDGDGKADKIYWNKDISDGHLRVSLATGGGKFNERYSTSIGSGDSSTNFYFADVNGDGKADKIYWNTYFSGGQIRVYLAPDQEE